jgi:hypothetical protein
MERLHVHPQKGSPKPNRDPALTLASCQFLSLMDWWPCHSCQCLPVIKAPPFNPIVRIYSLCVHAPIIEHMILAGHSLQELADR